MMRIAAFTCIGISVYVPMPTHCRKDETLFLAVVCVQIMGFGLTGDDTWRVTLRHVSTVA